MTSDASGVDLLQPLDTEECQQLETFLQTKQINSIMVLFGYLTAVMSSPTVISPAIWLHGLLGEEALFENTPQARLILNLIARIENRLRIALEKDKQTSVQDFMLYPTMRTAVPADLIKWCEGYMQAVILEPGYYLNTQFTQVQQALNDILILAASDEMLDSSLHEEGISADKKVMRDEALINVLKSIYSIYEIGRDAIVEE